MGMPRVSVAMECEGLNRMNRFYSNPRKDPSTLMIENNGKWKPSPRINDISTTRRVKSVSVENNDTEILNVPEHMTHSETNVLSSSIFKSECLTESLTHPGNADAAFSKP